MRTMQEHKTIVAAHAGMADQVMVAADQVMVAVDTAAGGVAVVDAVVAYAACIRMRSRRQCTSLKSRTNNPMDPSMK